MSQEKDKDEQKKQASINPIDKDKIADDPHLLPYAHTVGGVKIEPTDKGKIKGRAMAAMYEQTDSQFEQLKEQMETLVRQAKALQERIKVSEKIYLAELNFEPIIGKTYYLYQRPSEQYVVSMISPEEWGKSIPFAYIATVTLLSDHTWNIEDADTDLI